MKNILKVILEAKLKRGELISHEDISDVIVLKLKDTCDTRLLTLKRALMIISMNESQPDCGMPSNTILLPLTTRLYDQAAQITTSHLLVPF